MGVEASADPTAVEAQVRADQDARLQVRLSRSPAMRPLLPSAHLQHLLDIDSAGRLSLFLYPCELAARRQTPKVYFG